MAGKTSKGTRTTKATAKTTGKATRKPYGTGKTEKATRKYTRKATATTPDITTGNIVTETTLQLLMSGFELMAHTLANVVTNVCSMNDANQRIADTLTSIESVVQDIRAVVSHTGVAGLKSIDRQTQSTA